MNGIKMIISYNKSFKKRKLVHTIENNFFIIQNSFESYWTNSFINAGLMEINEFLISNLFKIYLATAFDNRKYRLL